MRKSLIVGLLSLMPIVAFASADQTMTVINGTDCLFDMDKWTTTKTTPINIYVYTNSGQGTPLTFSGVVISPPAGNTVPNVPLTTDYNIVPPMPALYIGTTAKDDTTHITENIPTSPGVTRMVVQEFSQTHGACPPDNPCVAFQLDTSVKCGG